MSDIQPRDVEIGAVLWFLGAVVLSTLCVGSVLLFNTITQRRLASPTPVPLPEVVFIPSSTPTTEQVLVVPTPIPPTITPIVDTPIVVTSTGSGNSCKYGPPFINPVATPVPDGGHSQYQDYLCVNGYWYIGSEDWLDSKGDWGTDGIAENGYIMFNADGSIADRKFTNLQGTSIPGPTK